MINEPKYVLHAFGMILTLDFLPPSKLIDGHFQKKSFPVGIFLSIVKIR